MPDKVKVDYVLEKNEFIDVKGQEAGNGNHYVKEQGWENYWNHKRLYWKVEE